MKRLTTSHAFTHRGRYSDAERNFLGPLPSSTSAVRIPQQFLGALPGYDEQHRGCENSSGI